VTVSHSAGPRVCPALSVWICWRVGLRQCSLHASACTLTVADGNVVAREPAQRGRAPVCQRLRALIAQHGLAQAQPLQCWRQGRHLKAAATNAQASRAANCGPVALPPSIQLALRQQAP
jgi:hypothetical protein